MFSAPWIAPWYSLTTQFNPHGKSWHNSMPGGRRSAKSSPRPLHAPGSAGRPSATLPTVQGQNKDKTRTTTHASILHPSSYRFSFLWFFLPGEPPHWGQSIKWEPTLGPRPWRSFLKAPSVPNWDLLLSCWDLHQDPCVSQCQLKNMWNLILYHTFVQAILNCRLNSNPCDCMLVLMMWIDYLRPLCNIMWYYVYGLYKGDKDVHQRGTNKNKRLKERPHIPSAHFCDSFDLEWPVRRA